MNLNVIYNMKYYNLLILYNKEFKILKIFVTVKKNQRYKNENIYFLEIN